MIAAHVIHVTLFLCATKMYSAIAAVHHHNTKTSLFGNAYLVVLL